MRFELEKGSKKYICPACSQKRFVRYVKRDTNEQLDSDVGRCDRESSCGYHFTPKMYFAENPSLKIGQIRRPRKSRLSRQSVGVKTRSQTTQTANNTLGEFDLIPGERLLETLCNYEQNGFVQFLLNLFPDSLDEIENTVKDYYIGTTKTGRTIYWQIDKNNRVRTGKIIAYDAETGKRRKDIFPNWTHAELKKRNLLKQDFNLKQCFFGEHLLRKYPNKNICITEAEKTAVIASIFYPNFVWLAIGSKQNLKFEKIKQLGRNRKIILYPDADGFDLWNKTAQTARTYGFDISISKIIQTNASERERIEGYDLADYLIAEQKAVNRWNEYVKWFNEKIDLIKKDAELFEQFNTILAEQKAILIIDGKLSENEAESLISQAQNVREVVLSLF